MSGSSGVQSVYAAPCSTLPSGTAFASSTGNAMLVGPRVMPTGGTGTIADTTAARACLFSHYDGGDATQVLWRPWWDIVQHAPVLSLDYSTANVSPWGDNQQMTDMNAGLTYLNTTGQIAAFGSKINLLGVSMGGLNSLVWAAHYASSVNAIFIGSPALSLYSAMYAPYVGLGVSQINVAYSKTQSGLLTASGDTAPPGVSLLGNGSIVANRDPYWMSQNGQASAFTGWPIIILQGGIKLTGLSITSPSSSGGVATATITGAGITTSNVSVGMWLTWQGMNTSWMAQVTAVSNGSATIKTMTCYATGTINTTTINGTGIGALTPTGCTVIATNTSGAQTTTTVSGYATNSLTISGWSNGTPTGGTPVLVTATSQTSQSSAPFWFSNDAVTWPIFAEQFATSVNAAGGNVQIVTDNFAGHATYSGAANDAAIAAFLQYA